MPDLPGSPLCVLLYTNVFNGSSMQTDSDPVSADKVSSGSPTKSTHTAGILPRSKWGCVDCSRTCLGGVWSRMVAAARKRNHSQSGARADGNLRNEGNCGKIAAS